MRKTLSLLLVLVMVSMLFVGCNNEQGVANVDGGDSTTKKTESTTEKKTESTTEEKTEELEEVTITMAFAGGDPLSKQQIEDRIDGFMEENPNVTILGMPSGSGAYLDFIKTKDAVGEFPDVIESRDTAVWVRAEKLAPLPEETTSYFDEEDLPLYEGVAYVAPKSLLAPACGVFYNVKMFEKYGLEEPTTYQEFLDLCQVLVDNGESPLVVGGKDAWHTGFTWSYYWNKFVFSENPDWIADRYRGNVSFQDDNIVAMFEEYAALFSDGYVEKGWLSTGDNQIASFLVTEKAAMFVSGSWMMQQIQDADPSFEYGWFPIPDDEGNYMLVGGASIQGWALSAEAAEDPAKVAAFNAFMSYWFRDDIYVPYLIEGSQYASIKDKPEMTYENPIMAEFDDALNTEGTFVSLMWNNKWGENELIGAFRNYSYKAFQEMIATGGSVEDLCKALDAEWDLQAAQFNPTK